MRKNYYQARAYLFKLNTTLYKDVLHDAFVNYHRRTGGKNLFEEPNRCVITVIKNQFYEMLRSRMYKKDGVKFYFEHTTYDDNLSNPITPVDILIGEEAYDKILSRVDSFDSPKTAKAILDLRLEGYSTKEIAEQLNLTTSQVNTYTRNLQKDRPGVNKVSDRECVEIQRLSELGYSLQQICNKTNRSIKTVWKVVNMIKKNEDKQPILG